MNTGAPCRTPTGNEEETPQILFRGLSIAFLPCIACTLVPLEAIPSPLGGRLDHVRFFLLSYTYLDEFIFTSDLSGRICCVRASKDHDHPLW
jgi:hypothetical protein